MGRTKLADAKGEGATKGRAKNSGLPQKGGQKNLDLINFFNVPKLLKHHFTVLSYSRPGGDVPSSLSEDDKFGFLIFRKITEFTSEKGQDGTVDI